jgi:lipid II:glycine glycyltransferase (peptidoglycan interpeptide bridge formation enzyme)
MDDVWKGFHQGTKRAVKKGQQGCIYVQRITRTEDLRKAHDAWLATAARKGFSDIRPWATIEPVLRRCVDDGIGSVLASFLGERLLAAIFLAHVGKTATYVYGGYVDGCEQYHPNHVLHYEAIQHCLENGMGAYNFGDLNWTGPLQPNGINQFKLGFGAVPHTQLDTIIWKRKPLMYHLVEQLGQRRFGQTLQGLVKWRLMRRGKAA